MPPRRTLGSRAATRTAFGVIIVFVLAQVMWWLIFQHRYITWVSETTLAAWQRDAEAANAALAASADPSLADELLRDYPHLSYEGGRFAPDAAAVAAFERRQRGYLRMFAYEGPFFVLVVLSGLWIIARNLRAERELKRRQQNFLAAVTHEFKTPMSTLRLLVETAQLRRLPLEKQRDYLSRMAAELSRLERTSEQVLAAARLEQSREPPVLEPAELCSVVRGLVAQARAGLEARGAAIELLCPDEPLPVSLELGAFGVVLNNLLDNAVKYSPGTPKPVTVRLESRGDLALVHVEDQGLGVPEAERALIFERFYRQGSELTREAPGIGLGLYLVRTITEAMNGWVRLEANAPRGARFTVVLPKRVTADQAQGGGVLQRSREANA